MVSQSMIIGVGVLGAIAVGGFLFFRPKPEEEEKRDENMPKEDPPIKLPNLTDKVRECYAAGGVWQSGSMTCVYPPDPQGDYEFVSGGDLDQDKVPKDMIEPKVDPIYEEYGDYIN